MIGGEGGVVDDVVLFLGLGFSVRVGGVGVFGGWGIRVGRGEFLVIVEF